MSKRPIEDALRDLTDRLASIPGVLGTAQGRRQGRACVTVYVARKTPELLRQISDAVAGYPVAVEEAGEFRALER